MLKDPHEWVAVGRHGKDPVVYTRFTLYSCSHLKSIYRIKVIRILSFLVCIILSFQYVSGALSAEGDCRKELILVLEGDLYLVPFPVLRSSNDGAEYLCERYSLFVIPNLLALRSSRMKRHDTDQQVNLF